MIGVIIIEVQRILAEIWRKNNEVVSKIFVFNKELKQITLDPYLETADTNLNNNYWPEKTQATRFQLFKSGYGFKGGFANMQNPMQKARK